MRRRSRYTEIFKLFWKMAWLCIGMLGVVRVGYTSDEVWRIECDVTHGMRITEQELARTVVHPVVCTDLQIVTDVPDGREALRMSLALAPALVLDVHTIWAALERCSKQKRYATVTIVCDQKGVLKVSAQGAYIVDRIKVTGMLIGRDRYRHVYGLHAGDMFDLQQHRDGVAAMVKLLNDEGHAEAVVEDRITYDADGKTVCVYLAMRPGPRYTIRAVRIACVSNHVARDTLYELERACGKRLRAGLMNMGYSRQLVEHETEVMCEYLVGRGYLGAGVALHETLTPETHSYELLFTTELSGATEYVFQGNHSVAREELLAHIMRFGSSLSLIPGVLIADEIQEYYRTKGFWDAIVQFRDDGARWYFFITEGLTGKITTVQLRGVSPEREQQLRKMLFSNLKTQSIASRDDVAQALASMMRCYLELGYWDARIEEFQVVTRSGCVELDIVIHEGTARVLCGVTCDICPGVDPSAFLNPYGMLEKAIPFDIRIIEQHKRILQRRLSEHGYLYVTPVPELRESSEGVVLHWNLRGDLVPVRFGATILRGNGTVSADVILRECAYREGDLWDSKHVDTTVARLRGLGIFESVTLVPDDISRAEQVKDLILEVVPDTLYELRVRGGAQGVSRYPFAWNGGPSYKAGGSVLFKNLLNQGDVIRCDLDFSRYIHDVAAVCRIPRLFERPIRTEIRAFSTRYDQPIYIGAPEVLYRMSYAGVLVGLGHWEGDTTGGINMGCAAFHLASSPCGTCGTSEQPCVRQRELMRALSLNPCFFQHQTWYLCVEPTCMVNRLDNPVDPTRGSLTVCSLKGMMPPALRGGGFLKILFEQSAFFPFCDAACVLALRLRFGSVLHADFDHIPPSERFYLGGANSIRGYEPDYVPPLHSFVNCNEVRCAVPIGGKSMVNGNAEVRFPIYQSVRGVIFADVGTLSDQGVMATVWPGSLTGAVGCGMRWHTIIGPIRFDIGWKIPRHAQPACAPEGDKSYAWFVTLGHAF